MMDVDKMFTDRINHIPKSGYNVIGIDAYELPGEQLYLVKWFLSYDEAKAYVDSHKSGDRLTILGSEDI